MSQTLTLTGKGNTLTTTYHPPIKLEGAYGLGLAGFYGCNSIRNIFPGNNKLYYIKKKEVVHVEIPSGAYEIEELNKFIQNGLCPATASQAEKDKTFSLKPNNNTLQCEVTSSFTIDFTQKDSIG